MIDISELEVVQYAEYQKLCTHYESGSIILEPRIDPTLYLAHYTSGKRAVFSYGGFLETCLSYLTVPYLHKRSDFNLITSLRLEIYERLGVILQHLDRLRDGYITRAIFEDIQSIKSKIASDFEPKSLDFNAIKSRIINEPTQKNDSTTLKISCEIELPEIYTDKDKEVISRLEPLDAYLLMDELGLVNHLRDHWRYMVSGRELDDPEIGLAKVLAMITGFTSEKDIKTLRSHINKDKNNKRRLRSEAAMARVISNLQFLGIEKKT